MEYTGIFLAGILIATAIYHLLPAIICSFDRRLASAGMQRISLSENTKHAALLIRWLPGKWIKLLHRRLQKAGYFTHHALLIYLALQVLPIPILLLLGSFTGHIDSRVFLIGMVTASLINSHISRRIAIRQQAFAQAMYRIYRFLDMQITAGIKVVDSLRGLPEAVENPIVYPILIRFAALFELTMNLDLAMDEIRKAFPGTDCELLATHLQQCMQTGQAGRSLAHMEELLFARYFSLMQADTKKIRNQLLMAAMLGIFPALSLFLFPLLFEAISAVKAVFG